MAKAELRPIRLRAAAQAAKPVALSRVGQRSAAEARPAAEALRTRATVLAVVRLEAKPEAQPSEELAARALGVSAKAAVAEAVAVPADFRVRSTQSA